MTEHEIATEKTKAIVLFGFGLASFVAAYLVPEDDFVELAIGLVFVLAGLACMVLAGRIAKGLKTESAAK